MRQRERLREKHQQLRLWTTTKKIGHETANDDDANGGGDDAFGKRDKEEEKPNSVVTRSSALLVCSWSATLSARRTAIRSFSSFRPSARAKIYSALSVRLSVR